MQTDFFLEARRSFELAAQATQQHEMVLYAEIGRKCLTLTYAALNTDQPNENSVPLLAKPKEIDFDSIDFSQVHEHH